MNEVEAQKLFNKKRRQHFLGEERNNKFIHDFEEEVDSTYQTWKISADLATRSLFRLKADDFWDFLRLKYTAGEEISQLPPMLDEIINVLEISTQFWFENKKELNEIGYYTPPMPWFYADYYLKVIQLIAVCYLLQREDLLERLLQVILDNAAGDLEPDTTIEDFFYYRFKDRPDPEYVQMGKHAILISDAIREKDKNEKIQILNAYLKDWYHEMVGLTDGEYQSHLDHEQNGFCGYWSFEAAAIAYLDDLDDTSLRQYPYYPKDMVDWAREQKQQRLKAEDNSDNLPLLLNAGTPAPFTGKYGIENFIGHEIMLQQGEPLPAGQVSAERDKNGNPVYRNDTVWRLLQREDGGKVRFKEEELKKWQPKQ